MISRDEFCEELKAIIFAQEKKEKAEKALNDYIKGWFFVVPDANEERALRFLSGLIGLGIGTESPLLDWYYNSSRKSCSNRDFFVITESGEKILLETPEDFYNFYCEEQPND